MEVWVEARGGYLGVHLTGYGVARQPESQLAASGDPRASQRRWQPRALPYLAVPGD